MNLARLARCAGIALTVTTLLVAGCVTSTTQTNRPDPAVSCTIQEVPIRIEPNQAMIGPWTRAYLMDVDIGLAAIDGNPISAMRGLASMPALSPGWSSVVSAVGNDLRPLTPYELESGQHVLRFSILGVIVRESSNSQISPIPIAAACSMELELMTGENYFVSGRVAPAGLPNGFLLTVTEESTGRVLVFAEPAPLTIPLPDR